ncbi:MAG: iron-containing alcohol dehydrogenase [Bacillota bacterium]|nr:iron-containing alcohol dehydrogenase [Bacillota bacterium]
MLGNFVYSVPTKVYFGEHSVNALEKELPKYGEKVLLCYGGGSIKKNGIYDAVREFLEKAGKQVFEVAGVMPNPTLKKVLEGAEIARTQDVDLILAVGGGSVIDYAKAVSAAAHCGGDPWEKFYAGNEVPERVIPIGAVLTMVGTGSEMNGTSVVTHTEAKLKFGCSLGDIMCPKFSILDPVYTYSLPKYQMVAGIFDIMSHIFEQYFSGHDENVSDYLSEGLMRAVIAAARVAVVNPHDYEARSNIMWAATWALNSLIGKGKPGDWEVHAVGHAVSAYTDATHGMTLACVTLPYFRHIMDAGLHRFKRFAESVWNVRPEGKTDEEIAREGLKALEAWMNEIGVVMNVGELGVREDMVKEIADSALIRSNGYKTLTHAAIADILRESLAYGR